MRIVVDTNVLISGLLSPFGAPAEIIRMIVLGDVEICYDARIISEYEEVLKRAKFAIDKDDIEDLIAYIKHFGYITATKVLSHNLPDRDDEPFLEAAIAARASYLITGNIQHYPARLRQGINVLTPSQFLSRYSR